MNHIPLHIQGDSALRTPPHSYDAERALLGSILMNNRAFERVADFLEPQHFADPANGEIFKACSAFIGNSKAANPVTLKNVLRADLVPEGVSKYLANLAAGAVTIINAGDYGKLIYDLFLRRELIALGEDMVNDAFESSRDESAIDQIESAESKLFGLTVATNDGGFSGIASAALIAVKKAELAYQRDGKLIGVDTGLVDLNRRLGGLHEADLLILAGRPSMGKTALAMTMAYNAALSLKQEGGVVAFFSLEMAEDQLTMRPLAHLTSLDVHKIRNGQLSGADIGRLSQAVGTFESLPLYVDDTPGLTVQAMRTRCRRLARQHAKGGGLKLVVIDYLQLIGTARADRVENRVQELSLITRGLKALAKEFDVPVLALSQLSRAVEQREDKRPQLSDLRESGSIEQDADVVMFVYREEYYLERAQPSDPAKAAAWAEKMDRCRNIGEVITAKQRQGPVGTDQLHFDGPTTWFSDLARDRN